jgi:RNA polymerase II subunit A small phosphatase-like protein
MRTDARILLILDLDETLIYAADSPLDYPPLFISDPHSVYARPYATEFLLGMAKQFEMAVWSSAREDYVAEVVEHVFPKEISLRFVWSRKRCTLRYDLEKYEYPYHIKDLRKVRRLGYDLRRVLMVDDTPQKLERHYGNAVYVRSFEGDRSDDELIHLGRYLSTLATVENVRTIEKRGWRKANRS